MSSASTSTSTSASSSTPGTPPPASNNPAFDAEIKQAFARNEALRPLLADLAGLVAKHTHAEYAGFWQKDNAGKLQPLVNDAANAEFRESNGWRALTAGCHQALDRLDLFVGALQDNPQDRVVAAPIYAPNGQPFVLGVILRDHEIATHTRIAMVDHVAGATSHWQLMQALGRLDWEAQAAAAAAELVSQIQTTDSLRGRLLLDRGAVGIVFSVRSSFNWTLPAEWNGRKSCGPSRECRSLTAAAQRLKPCKMCWTKSSCATP